MIIKMYWEGCPEFVVEGEDGFVIEANQTEALGKIVPILSPHEKLKFEQMREFYMAKATVGIAREGCYYFLVSCDAQAVKFESVALLTSELSGRGGKVRMMPEIPIENVADVCNIDPAAY